MAEKRRILSDLELLEIVEKYDDADRICEVADITKSTLLRRYPGMVMLKKEYIPIKNLVESGDVVKVKATGVTVGNKVLGPLGYKSGDKFKVDVSKKGIITLKVIE